MRLLHYTHITVLAFTLFILTGCQTQGQWYLNKYGDDIDPVVREAIENNDVIVNRMNRAQVIASWGTPSRTATINVNGREYKRVYWRWEIINGTASATFDENGILTDYYCDAPICEQYKSY